MSARLTPSQTVGPFFAIGLGEQQNELVAPTDPGAIRIVGRVLDGADEGLPDALVEIWQANAGGHYEPGFGWGRCSSDAEGRFEFVTIKPGATEAGRAPHIAVLVFARGLLKPVLTRLYFPDETDANAADPVFAALPEGERETIVAVDEHGVLRFDLRLQGDTQTPFFLVGSG